VLAASAGWKPAHGVFLVLLVPTVVAWASAELRQALKRRPEATTAGWGGEVVLRATAVAGALLAALAVTEVPAADIRPAALAAWLGLLFLWCGIALRIWCFRTLGRYFTLTVRTSRDQPVIADGPYRVLRHPSYSGLLLAFIGLGLFIGNWLSVLALGVGFTIGIVSRIRMEERALVADLGDRYLEYAATRKRLVPFVW
jgi:protein-S-isoprenylcysteine O-methyltransferase Ste14